MSLGCNAMWILVSYQHFKGTYCVIKPISGWVMNADSSELCKFNGPDIDHQRYVNLIGSLDKVN